MKTNESKQALSQEKGNTCTHPLNRFGRITAQTAKIVLEIQK